MKQNKKQIVANVRNEVAKNYNKRIEELRTENKKYWNELQSAWRETSELKHKVEELEEKLREKDDWIERLQEFCNLSDEDRKKAIEKYKTDLENDKKFNNWLDRLNYMSSLFFM